MTYIFQNATAFDPHTGEGVPNATGQVFAMSDTGFTTPLVVTTLSSGLQTTELVSDQYSQLPGFDAGDNVQVRFRSGEFVKILNTSTPLVGPTGDTGKSAYEVAVEGGYTGTEAEYNATLADAGSLVTRAETAEQAAVDAANLVGAPADTAIATAIGTKGTLTETALSAAIDARGRIFNVLDYGAIGLGISDETAAVQSACDAIGAAGRGKLYFPLGRYVMDRFVTIPSNIEIYGDGAEILKLSGASSQTVFVGFSNGQTGYGSGSNNITAHSLTFRGTFEGAIPRGVCAFSLNHTDGLKTWDLHFIEASGNGHQFDLQGCRNVRINTPVAKGFRTEFGVLHSEFVQIDCSFRIGGSEKDAPGSYDGLPTLDVIVDGGKFLPLTIGAKTYPSPIPMGAHAVGEGVYYRDIRFTNNYMEHLVEDVASNTPGVTHWMSVDGLTITGNTFNNTTSAACFAVNIQRGGFAYPISQAENGSVSNIALAIPQPCKNITLEDNEYIGFKNISTLTNIVSIYGTSGAQFTDLFIDNERFIDCTPDYTTAGGGSCIRLVEGRRMKLGVKSAFNIKRVFDMANCSGFTISSGSIEKSSASVAVKLDTCTRFTVGGMSFEKSRGALDLTGCSRFTVFSNELGEDSSITSGPAMIRIVGGSSVFAVTGNTIYGTATTASAISIGGTSSSGVVQSNVGKWGGAVKIFIDANSPTVTQVNNSIT